MSEVKNTRLRRFLKNPSFGFGMFLNIYDVIRSVYRNREKPPYTLLKVLRDFSRKLYIRANEITPKDQSYQSYTVAIIGMLFIFWATIAFNIYTTFTDILAFGESLMFLIGVSMVCLKIVINLKYCKKIDAIVCALIELDQRSEVSKSDGVLKIQRSAFLIENFIFLFSYAAGFLLFFTLSMQPILTEQSIPLPALFPFNLQDPKQHPWGIKLVYSFQVVAIFCALFALITLDSIGGCCIIQLVANLRILSVRLRELGACSEDENYSFNMREGLAELVELHQHIIFLVDETNDAYYYNFLVQSFSSTIMLGMAGFEVLLSLHNLMVAFKYAVFMFVAVFQLFYWCIIGNFVYYDSQDVAIAGFEVNEWFMQHPALQRNLMFLIQRAQKPLQIRAQPFYPFTMETFTKIIRVSYTAFTILKERV